jgi:hypothetical protein
VQKTNIKNKAYTCKYFMDGLVEMDFNKARSSYPVVF